MENINISIPMTIKLINEIEKIAKHNGLSFDEYIVKELEKAVKDQSKITNRSDNIKNCSAIIEKYRSM